MLPLVVSVAHLKLLSHVTQEKITLSLLEYHSPLLSSLYGLVGFPGYQQQHILHHLRDPLEQSLACKRQHRCCGSCPKLQWAVHLMFTQSAGPWRYPAADPLGHPQYHLFHTTDTDTDIDKSLLTLLCVLTRQRGQSAHINYVR